MTDKQNRRFLHKKTGNIYNYLGEVTDCTNKNGGEVLCVLYERNGKLFIREKNEFFEKFEEVKEICKMEQQNIKLFDYDISKVLTPNMTDKAIIGTRGYFGNGFIDIEQAIIYGQTAILKKTKRELFINDKGRRFSYFLPLEFIGFKEN